MRRTGHTGLTREGEVAMIMNQARLKHVSMADGIGCKSTDLIPAQQPHNASWDNLCTCYMPTPLLPLTSLTNLMLAMARECSLKTQDASRVSPLPPLPFPFPLPLSLC